MGRFANTAQRRIRRVKTYALAVPGRLWWPDSRFFILSRGRAGSTLLAALLDAHPSIRCDGELLAQRMQLPLTFVDGRCAAAGRSGNDAYGFKILTHHLWRDRGIEDPRPFIGKLRARGYRAIRLTRDNPLRGAISWQNLLQRQDGRRPPSDTSEYEPMTVDPSVIMRWLDDTQPYDEYERLAVSEIENRSLVYESNLQRRDQQQQTVDELCDWLGLERHSVEAGRSKQIPERSIAELVANYSELEAALAGTCYESLLK
jgi:hypothetical protein